MDLCCGSGGASIGFYREGFECWGLDIEDLGYPYKFVQADLKTVDPEKWVYMFDVIWASPVCRDYSLFAKRFGKTWKKNPPNPENGLELVAACLRFIDVAKPKFWIMENVPGLAEYLEKSGKFFKMSDRLIQSPRFIANLRGEKQMVRAFWGNFPEFLLPRDNKNVVMRFRPECNSKDQVLSKSEDRAKIPICVSQAFAKACKEKIIISNSEANSFTKFKTAMEEYKFASLADETSRKEK